MKTSPISADATVGRIAHGTKVLAEGGYEKKVEIPLSSRLSYKKMGNGYLHTQKKKKRKSSHLDKEKD